MAATNFYFVRHGNAYDAAGLQTPQSPLNQEGMEQAQWLGRALAGESFDVVLVSPFTRAQETCQLAAGGIKIKPVTVTGLAEVGNENWPHPLQESVPTLENIATEIKASRTHVQKTWEELKTQYTGQKVLIFGHGNWIRLLLCNLLNLDDLGFNNFRIDFASVTTVEVQGNNTVIRGLSCTPGPVAKKLCSN